MASPGEHPDDESTDGGFGDAVEQMLSGDEDAFRIVYRSVQPGLLRYLTVMVGTTDAEDVAAEAWAQGARDMHRFTGDGDGFRGWITTIGRNRALDHLRAKARRPVVDAGLYESLEEIAASHPTVRLALDAEREALDSLSTQAALALIGTLPQDQAEAVLLRAVIGLDAKSAGQVLGKRPGAVRTAAYRGLRSLAQRLEGDGFLPSVPMPTPVEFTVPLPDTSTR